MRSVSSNPGGAGLPVAVAGGGPVGLITALGLSHYGMNVVLFEEDDTFSHDTKAGTILTRTLEVLDRYGAADEVIRIALRVDEIGDIDRATGATRSTVDLSALAGDTRFPFVVNAPQHQLEPALRDCLEQRAPGTVRMQHRVVDFRQDADHVDVIVRTPHGTRTVRAAYLLACDGGRSRIRKVMGAKVSGYTLEQRYALVDLAVDLDIRHSRDYPYLAYFGDPAEWLILVRQPHCWRIVFPLAAGHPVPEATELSAKARHFIGETGEIRVLGSTVYTVHHRVADRWRDGRVFLLGDAAHLITPMWALGLNTGVLDASNLPWRLAWVLRGLADERLLAGYEREQSLLAIRGSAQLAESARIYMSSSDTPMPAMAGGCWGVAATRALLGVRLDVEGTGEWSMIAVGQTPAPIRVGDRLPDLAVFPATPTDTGNGASGLRLHDLCRHAFVALYFTDPRHRPHIPTPHSSVVRTYVVSRWDALPDSGLRRQQLFDPGDRLRRRLGIPVDTAVLVRPDAHIAAILPIDPADGISDPVADAYARITGCSL